MKDWGVFSIILAVTFLSGCSVFKNMQEMHDTTVGMAKTTDKMNQKMDETNENTADMYADSRQGIGSSVRRDALGAMRSAQSMGEKINQAAQYVLGFEYQGWKGRAQDTGEKRTMLFKDAMEEFFKTIREFITLDELTKMDPGTESAQMQNFFALSVVLHQVNTNQTLKGKQLGFEVESLYSLFKKALLQLNAVESGSVSLESLPEYQLVVLENSEIVIKILEARHNFLAALTLGDVVELGGTYEKAKKRYLDSKITVDLGKKKLAYLKKWNKYLWASLEARSFLMELGVPYYLNSDMKVLFEKMDIRESKDSTLSQRKAAIREFREHVNGLVGRTL